MAAAAARAVLEAVARTRPAAVAAVPTPAADPADSAAPTRAM